MQELRPLQLTGSLIRAARALAGLSAADLAAKTLLGERTIKRAEASPGFISLTAANAQRIIDVFGRMGVTFFVDGTGLWVRTIKATDPQVAELIEANAPPPRQRRHRRDRSYSPE